MFEEAESIVSVTPSRLKSGYWCHDSNKQKDEGDISASYSADVIALESRVRQPFVFQGGLYVSVGGGNRPKDYAKIYQLVLMQHFDGQPKTYSERCLENARECSQGFYHGVKVQHGKNDYILCGAEIIVVASDEPELVQGALF